MLWLLQSLEARTYTHYAKRQEKRRGTVAITIKHGASHPPQPPATAPPSTRCKAARLVVRASSTATHTPLCRLPPHPNVLPTAHEAGVLHVAPPHPLSQVQLRPSSAHAPWPLHVIAPRLSPASKYGRHMLQRPHRCVSAGRGSPLATHAASGSTVPMGSMHTTLRDCRPPHVAIEPTG